MTAVISKCGLYRYTLERGTRDSILRCVEPLTILWVMLNPSTADAEKDDPTIRGCKRYSAQWGFDRMLVGNLFAYRTPSPWALWASHKHGVDVVGPENDEHLNQLALRADRVVVAWGAQAEQWPERAEAVENLLLRHRELYTLGFTKLGHPRHPLYQPSDLELQRIERPL
jgi:hypothetical protein